MSDSGVSTVGAKGLQHPPSPNLKNNVLKTLITQLHLNTVISKIFLFQLYHNANINVITHIIIINNSRW